MRRLFILIGVFMLLGGGPAAAQEQRGSIEGVIKDPSGGVLPGVVVQAQSATLVGMQDAVTTAEGVYRFPALPPGTYTLTAALQGFTTARIENVGLELGQILRVDLSLTVATVAESVEVKAQAPLIDVKQNTSSTSIRRETIELIPKGRDFTDLVAFQAPGANNESRAGGLQIDGASGSENRFVIDGVDTTSLRSGPRRSGRSPTSSKKSRSNRAATTRSSAPRPAGSSAP